MKIIAALFYCFVIITTQAQPHPVVLSGTIKNSSSPQIFVTLPVAKKYFEGATQQFTRDTLTGNYHIRLNLTKPAFITIGNNWHTVKMYVVPGKKYIWNTVFQKKSNEDVFAGYDSEVNTLLNTIAATPGSRMADIGLDTATTVAQKRAVLHKALSEKIAPLQQLWKDHKVSHEFYKQFLNEINVWGKDVLSTHYYFEFRKTEDGRDKEKAAAFNKTIMPDWDKIYKGINDSLQWLSATAATSLLNRYSSYVEIKKTGELHFEKKYMDKMWNYFSHSLRGPAKEYALANVLYMVYTNNEYDKEIISGYKHFVKMFPKSPLIAYLKKPVAEVKAYHDNLNKNHPDVKFMELPQGVNTAAAFFPLLKNDKISYIDMWATWCLPCRMELKYAIPLHDDFEKIGVQVVYLSFDREADADKWRTMAKSLILKGTNIIASQALSADFHKTLKNFDGIPRYLILSPDGEMLEENAKRPTDQLDLLKQLQYYADKYNKK